MKGIEHVGPGAALGRVVRLDDLHVSRPLLVDLALRHIRAQGRLASSPKSAPDSQAGPAVVSRIVPPAVAPVTSIRLDVVCSMPASVSMLTPDTSADT